MKKFSTFSFFIIAFLLLTNSCKKEGPRTIDPEFAKYMAAFTAGTIRSSSDIQIELNYDVATVEINKEIEDDIFEFSPNIKGKAYWTSSHSIKFVPEPGELKQGQIYDAWFNLDKINEVEKGFEQFYFYFKIPEQNYSIDILPYSPSKDNDLKWNSVQGSLTLADDAEINDIQNIFSIAGVSNKPNITISPTETQGKYNITIDSLQRTDKDAEYFLCIDGSKIGVKRDAEKISIPIPRISSNSFSVIDVRTSYEPTECVRITFSDPLSNNQNIQGMVIPNGIENFSYDIQKNVLKLYLDGNNNSSSIDLNIYKELKSALGKKLDKTYNFSLSVEKIKPEVKLIGNGSILPNTENLTIPFQAVNLWAVDVSIIKIYENNILSYLQSNNVGGSNDLRRFGRLVLKKTIRLDEDRTLKLDEWNTFPLDLSPLIKKDPGAIYRVLFTINKDYSLYPCEGKLPQIPKSADLGNFNNNITEEDDAVWDQPYDYYYDPMDWYDYDWNETENPCHKSYYTNKKAETIVMSSNIGIIAKMGDDKTLQVATTDILSTKPLSGTTIDVYNYQMQRIGSGKTDSDGLVTIPYKGGAPFVVVASNEKDKGYLKMTSNLSLSLSNFDISGKTLEKGLKGYIYGERGVWRPGDSIYLTFILDDKANPLPKGHPVSLELYTPTGQLYQKMVNTSGVNGFYPFKLKTDANAVTGNWRSIIKVGGATFSKTIKIETVKPNRLKIRLALDEVLDASRGSFTTSLSSQWLHGAPATNLKATVEMNLSAVNNPFKGYEEYSFNNPINYFNTDKYTIFDSRLDASGNAQVTTQLPPATNAPGMLKATFVSRVFESGGDASIYTQTAAYSPYPTYIGIKSPAMSEYSMLETDTDNMIDIVTLSPTGKPVNKSNINVKIYKVRWSWWWSRNDDDLASYVNSTSAEVILNENISTSNGKAKVKFRVNYPEWGRYLVIASDENGGHSSGKILYVDWPSWRGRSDKQDPSGLTMLSFSTDKNSYSVGEKATVILPKSSEGRALISIENGSKIISSNWVKTSGEEDTKYTFEITDEMAPNFYIFATLLQPHAQTNNGLPIRMYGVLNINVDNKNTILTPVISMPDELKPEKEFTVSVSEKDKKAMTYTLAVVDEGLLDLTSFKTPNAWSDFYARQALGIRTWDMFDLVVGVQTGKLGPLLSIGGDEALKPSTNPVNRFKPIVKYLGPFSLKKGENQSHKIKLDPYVGSVRVMVVAGNTDGAYGSAEKAAQVKNPLMVLSTLPRVAGPGEEILLPVNVFVMDKKVKNVNITVQASNGLMQFIDGTSQSVSFTETGDKVVYFKIKVANKTGAEKITIKATGGGEVSNEAIDIEIRNPNPSVLLASEALVDTKNSDSLSITMDNPRLGDWAKLEVSRMPGVDLNKNLDFLFSYPYGCSEQVTSKAFPLLFVGSFKKFTDKENERMKYVVNEAIKILTSRQLADGGIMYWPGSSIPNEWVTTYAGHFLIEAQNKGYNVPESVISKWKQFQKKSAQKWNRRDLYNSYYSYSMSDLQQAYRLYTLALANQAELGAMNRLKESSNLSVQARWRLAAAYTIAGKKDVAKQIIQGADNIIENYSRSNNTYGSPSRDMAMIMETNLLLGETNKALAIAPKISEELNSSYITTQSAAYGLLAMSKLAEKMGKGLIAFDWTLNGIPQKKQGSGGVYQEFDIKPQENIDISFTNTGDGKLFVRLTGRTQPLVDKTPSFDNGVRLYVKYVDGNDIPIDVTSLQQGTEFFANVVIQNISGEMITDLALNQIFPSGWEIFNSRLFNPSDNSSSSFNYQDIRDDRVMTFFNLGYGYSTVVKIRLQAAYYGRFYLPAISCEAMYEPKKKSKTEGMWVEVTK